MEMQRVIGRQSVARRREPTDLHRGSRRRLVSPGVLDPGPRLESLAPQGRRPPILGLGRGGRAPFPLPSAPLGRRDARIRGLARLPSLSARFVAAIKAQVGSLPSLPKPLLVSALALPLLTALLLALATAFALSLPRAPELDALPSDPDFELSLLEYVGGTADAALDLVDAPPPPVSLELTRYRVRAGDALSTIARRFGVSVDSIVSLNGISSARALRSGAEILVPNMSGVVHTVARGESLSLVAKRRGTTVTALLDANDLVSETLSPGQTLFIPGARLPETELKRVLGELVIWPATGRISSWFGYRPSPFTGMRQFHNGIDIVAPYGSPAKAAMEGRVADFGFNTVYGNYVILAHAEGYQTWYAHLSKILVAKGARVAQGESVGLVGNTGVSTGTHLHFSVFKGSKAIDPLSVLKK